MALERVPADIRKDGGVARMSDPEMIRQIKAAVTIPVMAKARIGHFVEAQILEAVGVDYIDESEVLTPSDEVHHINKHNLKVPVLCGCRDLGEALRRIAEVRRPSGTRRPQQQLTADTAAHTLCCRSRNQSERTCGHARLALTSVVR
jgi:pyridoxal 5'-phosphate synthase subunit Pdx1